MKKKCAFRIPEKMHSHVYAHPVPMCNSDKTNTDEWGLQVSRREKLLFPVPSYSIVFALARGHVVVTAIYTFANHVEGDRQGEMGANTDN
jgi:hypothetical protein